MRCGWVRLPLLSVSVLEIITCAYEGETMAVATEVNLLRADVLVLTKMDMPSPHAIKGKRVLVIEEARGSSTKG